MRQASFGLCLNISTICPSADKEDTRLLGPSEVDPPPISRNKSNKPTSHHYVDKLRASPNETDQLTAQNKQHKHEADVIKVDWQCGEMSKRDHSDMGSTPAQNAKKVYNFKNTNQINCVQIINNRFALDKSLIIT